MLVAASPRRTCQFPLGVDGRTQLTFDCNPPARPMSFGRRSMRIQRPTASCARETSPSAAALAELCALTFRQVSEWSGLFSGCSGKSVTGRSWPGAPIPGRRPVKHPDSRSRRCTNVSPLIGPHSQAPICKRVVFRVRRCVGHAPFRSRLVSSDPARCTHELDRMESLAPLIGPHSQAPMFNGLFSWDRRRVGHAPFRSRLAGFHPARCTH